MSTGVSTAGPNTVVYLSLEGDLSGDEITRRVGIEPTLTRRYRNLQVGREVTDWRLDLSSNPIAFEAIREGGERLLAIGDKVAERVGVLVEHGATATLVVVQHISGDRRSKGMSVSPEALAWLAQARASIALDQYEWDGDTQD